MASKPPAPPKIAPKPGKVTVMRALYAYSAQQEDELSFNEGDVLYLVDQTDPSWWKARCGRLCGLIPSNYVELKMDTIENPIHDSARRGNLEFLKECLENGVSPSGLDASGNSPLHWSARGGHTDCFQELLRAAGKQFGTAKQFINAQNKLGDTVLHCAASKDHDDIVAILLESGANPNVLNKQGQLAIHLCHDPCVKTRLNNWNYVPGENDDDQEDEDYLEESDGEGGEDEGAEEEQDISTTDSRL